MSTSANTASSPVKSPAPTPSTLIVASKAFTEHRNLVLGTADLTGGSDITMHIAKTIQVHGQTFILWFEAWKWVYQIQAVDKQRACVNNIVAQKIRSLNAITKLSEEIFEMLKKDFIYLSLEKKESKKLRASPKGYIKAVSFIISP